MRPDAHDAYLHGRFLWFAGHNKDAGTYFQKAAELQPDYALAWAGLADYWIAGALSGQIDPADARPQAAVAARNAVSSDKSLAQSHVTMGAFTYFMEWNTQEALRECGKAIELDPGFAEAYHLRAKILAALNRHAEAVEAERKALDLNPFARPWGLVLELNWARRYDAAITEAKARLESAPEDPTLLRQLAFSYRAKGMEADAVRTTEAALRASSDTAGAQEMDRLFRLSGYRGLLEGRLNNERKEAARHYVSPVHLSQYTAQLRLREETLALLKRGGEERSPLLLEIGFDPAYDFLRSENRYRSLIDKVGLPRTW